MKKLSIGIVAVTSMLALGACKNGSNNTADTTGMSSGAVSPDSLATPAPAAPGAVTPGTTGTADTTATGGTTPATTDTTAKKPSKKSAKKKP